jgi:hypothetical protein
MIEISFLCSSLVLVHMEDDFASFYNIDRKANNMVNLWHALVPIN